MNIQSTIKIAMSSVLLLTSTSVFAQKPFDMAKSAPSQVWPGSHGYEAHIADLDIEGPAAGAEFLFLDLPDGSMVELERESYKKRGKHGNAVWMGRVVDVPDSRAVLTITKGVMFGFLRIEENIYEIRVRANQLNNGVAADTDKNYIVEKLILESFPENEEDTVELPENDAFIPNSQPDNGVNSDPNLYQAPSTANDATIIIDLMSLYTPTAKNSAGGVANIEVTIQAAVDAANAAFVDSGMNVQYRLVHVGQSTYDENSSGISSDLSWLVGDSNVASLRNQYGADMVSLIIENGGSSCGIGYVQRSPSANFAPYAFQVTDRGCAVGNLTFAHEHGHNLGMEHNPENSNADSSTASYGWSFGHYIYGSYRSVMSYGSICGNCTRVGRYSNPDISYLGEFTGINNQRDNSYTGELTAPIVAAYRSTVVPLGNSAPTFNQNPISGFSIETGLVFAESLASFADDIDGDTLSFNKVSGPSWLTVSTNGNINGTPSGSDEGMNSFIVEVTDGNGGTDSATVNVDVTSPQPINNNPTFNQNPITGFSVESGQTLTESIASFANDSDGDTLNFAKISGPNWLSITSNGAISGIPTSSDEGLNSFTVEVNDGNGGSQSATLNIDVTAPVVTPPTTSIEIIIDNQDSNTTFTGTWKKSGGANPWNGQSAYNNTGSTFRWTPAITSSAEYEVYVWWTYHKNRSNNVPYRIQHTGGIDQINVNQNDSSLGGQWVYLGSYQFTAGSSAYVEVSSENGQASADAVKLVSTSTEPQTPSNNPPVFNQNPITGFSVESNQNLNQSLASFADDSDGDTLSFSKVSGPSWLFVSSNGNISGTPTTSDEGINSFIVEVNDGQGGTDSANVNINVTTPAPTNTNPTFNQNPITGFTVESGQTLVGSLASFADDSDGDTLSFSKVSGPSWLSVSVNGNISGTPTASDEGTNSFIIEVNDGKGGTDTAAVYIEVTAPVIVPPSTNIEIIIDNTDSNVTYTGNWSASSGPNPWNGQSVYNNADSTYRWTPEITTTDTYDVYVWWTYHKNRSTNVPYRIQHDGGINQINVNQNDSSLGGQWIYMGNYQFTAGSSAYVEISSENGQASADAVKFVSN